ncbi:hypothetical protein GCM10010249_44360 [Streptomyces roseolilacinus]|uniref:Uncharacterized protein n=1 Tax=Streptomyces roseolilacinus TaxID=66904 RepID=A0A918EN09_9ACTN|nr:hypothetical protein GCM10010249_44360 [Streptomyces roseolilacinus]
MWSRSRGCLCPQFSQYPSAETRPARQATQGAWPAAGRRAARGSGAASSKSPCGSSCRTDGSGAAGVPEAAGTEGTAGGAGGPAGGGGLVGAGAGGGGGTGAATGCDGCAAGPLGAAGGGGGGGGGTGCAGGPAGAGAGAPGGTGPAGGTGGAGGAGGGVARTTVGWSRGGSGTADRSYPHAPQNRSPDSNGSEQPGQADS